MRIMKFMAISLIMSAAVLTVKAADTSAKSGTTQLNLIPWPKSVQMGIGLMSLKADSRIVAGDSRLRPLAAVLKEELLAITGLDLKIVPDSPRAGDIVLKINKDLKTGEEILMVKAREVVRTREGAYRLTVTGGVMVEGFDYRAVAEGTATLLQALTPQGKRFVIPVMTIDDWPHADYTGAMVDTARQDNPIQSLKLMVQTCRAYKVRYLQLHMTEDQAWTFPSKAFPALGTRNGSAHGGPRCELYKLDELKALVEYADERGVTLVPELETPGHSGNARGTLPEYFGYIDPATHAPVDQGVMNIFNPKLYIALDKVIGEMCDVFKSSPYFHIGFDEVGNLNAETGQAKEFMAEKKLASAGETMSYFAVQVNEMVKKRGKKTIRWEGPVNEASKDIIIMTWCDHAQTATPLIAQGFTTITVPWNYAGVEWPDWTMYHSNGSVLKKGDAVLGAMLPAWEQTGEVHVRWLRQAPARQERTWGPDNVFATNDFARRLSVTDRVLDRMLYGFAIRYDPAVTPDLGGVKVATPVMLSLETHPALGKVRYTVDGTEPDAHSPVADKPIRISDNFTIQARLFDNGGKPVKSLWRLPCIFEPLTISGRGVLKDGAGKDSTWFSGTMTAIVSSTIKTGKIRYTLDGSDPKPLSTAYSVPVKLVATTVVRAQWFDEKNVGRGAMTTATYQKLDVEKHAAQGKPAHVITPADLENRDAAAKLLTDGFLLRGGEWGSPEVLRLGPRDLEVVIDLGSLTAIKTVTTRFIHMQEAGIFPAVKMEVQVSKDGKEYSPLAVPATYKVPVNPESRGLTIQALSVKGNVPGRYVKVFCKNLGVDPDWHSVPGVPCHMMLDEIMVNPVR